MAHPRPHLLQPDHELARANQPAGEPSRQRSRCGLIAGAIRRAALRIARVASTLLIAAGSDTAVLLGASATGSLAPARGKPADPPVLLGVVTPPDLSGAVGRCLYPGAPGTVIRYSAAMLGSDMMTAYPWSPERGWSARN
jgi:hypothetical protein